MSQTVTPRRTTRSSAGSPPDPASPTSPSKSRPRRQLIPTAAAAAKEVEGEDERSAIDALLEALPCCRAQASDLLRLLAPSSALPLLLHGGDATGKTRVLLLTLRHIRPYPRQLKTMAWGQEARR